MRELPQGAPKELFEAFGYISSLDKPSVEDMKLMVFLEAMGEPLYQDMASHVQQPEAHALLLRSGREELAHAHRVAKAIGILTGMEFTVPSVEENPLSLTMRKSEGCDAATLANLAQAEDSGEDLYEKWARNIGNAEVAELFRQNGREEGGHAVRLREAARLMGV